MNKTPNKDLTVQDVQALYRWDKMIEKSNMEKVGKNKLFKKWYKQYKKADDTTKLKMLMPR